MGLRQLRKDRGWTLEVVAYLAGVDPATISRLERGKTAEPSPATVVALARTFGVSVDRMLRLLAEARESVAAGTS